MSDIIQLFNQFRDDVEKQQFLEKQHALILKLQKDNKNLQIEINHLKNLLTQSVPLLMPEVVNVIVTPEEAVIDKQIELLQARGIDRELTLEDTKKLDLLIKNKRLVKEQSTTIQGESKKIDKRSVSNAELILIASKKEPSSDPK